MFCLNCGHETKNPKFCSKTCSASYNNRLYPKKKKAVKACKYCGNPVSGRHIVCEACNRNRVDWSERTLGDLQAIRRFQVSSRIRALARDVYLKSSLPKACSRCGYDKHIEICHKKPIDSFSSQTPVAEINNLNNLIALCPNCHWEFDNNLFSL